MARIALGIEYDGSAFCGWQRQREGRSVQGVLEAAIAKVADHPVELTAAGRTDAGVHATAQVAHFDARARRPERAWVLGVNTHLPPDAAVVWSSAVDEDFHARFCAQRRSYRYLILNSRARSALQRDRACLWHQPLDPERMHAAAQPLVGTHDFSSFRAAECQARGPTRTIFQLDVRGDGGWIVIDVTADAFLHHMVRNLAGTLIPIGAGEAAIDWASEVLAQRDRRQAGVTAPPQGLYLVGVRYPRHYGLPVSNPGSIWPVFSRIPEQRESG